MKSTLKVTRVLGLTFITGSVSIDDFEVVPNTKKLSYADPHLRFCLADGGFQNVYASWNCLYKLPDELVEQLKDIPEYQVEFGDDSELKHIHCRIYYDVCAKTARVTKEGPARRRCEAANAALDSWLSEDMVECAENAFMRVIKRIHSLRDQINKICIQRFAEYYLNSINEMDDQIKELQEKSARLRKELEEAEQAEIARRKELVRERLHRDKLVPEELFDQVEGLIDEREFLNHTL